MNEKLVGYIIMFISAGLSAFIMVRVAIAELKKDIIHLEQKLDAEVTANNKKEDEHNHNMREVRDDVKVIMNTLTKIQVSQAKSDGRDEVLGVVKNTLETLATNKRRS